MSNNAYIYIPRGLVIPYLYATEDTPANEKTVYVKLFTPDSSWTWLIVEYDRAQDLAFGYAYDAGYPDGAEWGYISIAELRGIRGPLGLPIERDVYFEPRRFGEVKRGLGL